MLLFMCRLLTLEKIGCCSCAGYSPWGRYVAVHVQVTHPREDRLLFALPAVYLLIHILWFHMFFSLPLDWILNCGGPRGFLQVKGA